MLDVSVINTGVGHCPHLMFITSCNKGFEDGSNTIKIIRMHDKFSVCFKSFLFTLRFCFIVGFFMCVFVGGFLGGYFSFLFSRVFNFKKNSFVGFLMFSFK